MANSKLSLDYSVWTPSVRRLTIGLVRPNGYTHDGPPQHEYMCKETGVGSGSIYRESDLYETEAEARTAGAAKAAPLNADAAGWVAKQFAETAKFSDYQLKDAAIRAAEDRASRLGYDVQYLMEDLNDAQSIDEVKRSIEQWREKRDAAQ